MIFLRRKIKTQISSQWEIVFNFMLLLMWLSFTWHRTETSKKEKNILVLTLEMLCGQYVTLLDGFRVKSSKQNSRSKWAICMRFFPRIFCFCFFTTNLPGFWFDFIAMCRSWIRIQYTTVIKWIIFRVIAYLHLANLILFLFLHRIACSQSSASIHF